VYKHREYLRTVVADRGLTWDEAKARSNAKTHGVSFDEAQLAFSYERAGII